MGFSKDGKHQQPQIVLGLLVSENGYPLDYDIFEGNKYEGDTLIAVIDHFTTKYQSDRLIVVADAGLLSKKNIALLKERGYQYILGARIKNESVSVGGQILQLGLQDKQSAELSKAGERLIISYKEQRAHKDAHNRKRGLERFEKRLVSGKLSKKHINNKGYNKYLKMEGEVNISIDYDKFREDAQWDGLKGYLTNTELSKQEVIEKYNQLWTIEKAFRISKSDLRVRPISPAQEKNRSTHLYLIYCM